MHYNLRLERLQKELNHYECDALLIENPVDLLYLTGLTLSAGKLIVGRHHRCLFVDGRYSEYSLSQALYPVCMLENESLVNMLKDGQMQLLGFDAAQISYQRFLELEKLLPFCTLKPINDPILQLRMIKDADEIILLKKAAHLAYQGYQHVLSQLRIGVTEIELANALEFFWKERGARKMAFEPIIAFGANSSKPHYRCSDTPLKMNDHVLIDIGVMLSDYCSDMTRVHFFGTPPKEIATIYPLVEEAKNRALAACRPGMLIGELDTIARSYLTANGYANEFCHSLGHGLGLEVHEPPSIREHNKFHNLKLAAGMVITIEPGLYLPKIGGVRLEDTILITTDGYENLTKYE